jgi:hypothetical protein
MPIYENRGSYLFVTITEPYSLHGTLLFLVDMAGQFLQAHLEKALIDGSRLEGHISIWDRYQIGREYVRVIDPKIGIALVVPPGLINRVLENVIVNRSGTLRVFHEMEPALKWLAVKEEGRRTQSGSKLKG